MRVVKVARRYQSTDSVRVALISSMVKDGTYSVKTIQHMDEHARIVARYLGDMSLYDLSPDDLKDIALTMASEKLAISTQKTYIHTIKALLKFVNNPTYKTRVLFQADTRPRVDWLDIQQARAVLDSPILSPVERIAVTLALCMGLRRVEIVRLSLRDINLTREYITVTGKGRAGGKLRLVPFHDRFRNVLTEWLAHRAQLCVRARNDPPDNLLIWVGTDRIAHEYNAVKGSGIDGVIRRASRAVNVPFSAHTLRRTFGRIMWLAGVPVVTIARILGHSSTEQTLLYIGANLDDMAGAMNTIKGIL